MGISTGGTCARFSAVLVATAALACAADQIQIITGGDSVTAGPDGTLYMLGYGTVTTTPGAYFTTAPQTRYESGRNFLRHFDPTTGKILYTTYLNFTPMVVIADAKGAAYIGGSTIRY